MRKLTDTGLALSGELPPYATLEFDRQAVEVFALPTNLPRLTYFRFAVPKKPGVPVLIARQENHLLAEAEKDLMKHDRRMERDGDGSCYLPRVCGLDTFTTLGEALAFWAQEGMGQRTIEEALAFCLVQSYLSEDEIAQVWARLSEFDGRELEV